MVPEGCGAASPGFATTGHAFTTIAGDRASAFMARLATRGLDRQTMGAHPRDHRLVGQFTDPLSLAERPDDGRDLCG